MKIANTYDANGNLTKATTQQWNSGTNVWDSYMITSYTLNADATVKESLNQINNQDGNGWMNMSKSIFTYNASKQVLTETMQSAVGSTWMDTQTKTSTYNASGKVTLILNTQLTKNYRQTIYTYNSDGNSDQTLTQKWNTSNQWENLSRNTSSYNTSKVKTSELNENWVNGAWQNSSRYTYTMNAAGSSLSQFLIEFWTNGSWTNGSKILYTINSNLYPTQVVLQSWNTDLSVWENSSRQTWDYNITGIQPVVFAGKNSKVFPNPFVDILTIENGTFDELVIQLFNINGQLVSTFTTNGSVTDKSFGSLKMGTYFMKIKSPQNEQTIKLLKVE